MAWRDEIWLGIVFKKFSYVEESNWVPKQHRLRGFSGGLLLGFYITSQYWLGK